MKQNDKIRVCVVENDFIISETLQALLEKLGYEVAGVAMNETEGMAIIGIQKPDIALLDIGLKNEHGGIEIARYIRTYLNIPFIFITGNSDKTTIGMAKETNPDAYLLKPFREQDIATSIEIAMHNFTERKQQGTSERVVFIKHGGKREKIVLSDILYLESRHVYVAIIGANSELLVRESLGDLHEQINHTSFVKIHRSFIVNTRHIASFDSNFVYIDKHKLPISKTYLPQLEAAMKA